MNRTELEQYILDTYSICPDHPFPDDVVTAVYRHPQNRKWFGVLMSVHCSKLGLPEGGQTDIVNLKCDPLIIGGMRKVAGIFPAYHMNKEHWITVQLNRVDQSLLKVLLDQSYELTAFRAKYRKRKGNS